MSDDTKLANATSTRRRSLGRVGLFTAVAVASFALLTAIASAQTRKPGKKPATTPKKPTPTAIADAGAPAREGPSSTRPEPTKGASKDDGGAMVTKTGDGGTSLRFGEMEIEGRLRNPQLVYFLRRVRAEFAAGDLGHRSFMQELGETKDEPSF